MKKSAVIITITATVFWSMGSAFLIPPLPVKAAVDSTIIVNAFNGPYNSQQNTTIATSSMPVPVMKIQAYTSAVGKVINAVTLNFNGLNFATSTDLAALAVNNSSGVALYNGDAYGPNGGVIALSATPVWSGNNVTLTPTTPISLTSGTASNLYILIKTGADGGNGHQIIPTLPANVALTVNGGADTAGPSANFSANALVINTTVDTTGPAITGVEKVSYNAVDINFSEQIDSSSASSTSNFTFSGSPALTVTGIEQKSPNIFRVTASGGEITPGTHTLTVDSVITDMAGNANTSTTARPITAATKIKISEIAPYTTADDSEFIELYNAGDTGVNITGYKIQYSEANSGASWSDLAIIGSVTIPGYSYYLLGTTAFSAVSKNAIFTAGLNISGGHVRIINPSTGKELDKIGWGNAISPEGSAAVSGQAAKSLERKAFGSSTAATMKSGGIDASMGNTWDTDSNSFDFVLQDYPSPQNSSSAPENPMAGNDGGGLMINHMSINQAPTGAALNLSAQIGDPMTPIDQITAELHYMTGDGTPANNTTGDYTTALGTNQSNGYFQFTIPLDTVNASTANGIYYYLKAISSSATKYMSASPEADLAGDESTVAQHPFIISIADSSGWVTHNITGTIVDQSNLPIASAYVSLEGTGYTTATAIDGTFTLLAVKDNIYNLKIVKTGYYEGWYNNLFLSGGDFNIGTYTLSAGTGGGASGDTTKPRVNWTGPNDGMQGIPSGQEQFKIFIGFSKDMDNTSVNNTNIYLTANGTTPITSTISYDNDSSNNAAAGLPPDNYLGIVQAPTGGFEANTTYYLVMTGSVRDTSGNALEGNRPEGGHVISFSTGSNFMTGGFVPGDAASWTDFGTGAMMPPFVMGTNPNDGTMNVVPNIKININFSDPMDSTSVTTVGNIKLYKITYANNTETKTAVTITSALDTSSKIAVITPTASLSAGKYRVAATGALKSATGIFMGDPVSGQNTAGYEQFQSMFEVGANTAADNTKPTVIATWPTNNATGIQVNPGQLTIQFSEGMNPSSINASTITLKRNTTNITGTVTYDAMAHSANFSPSVVLSPSTIYTLTIAGDATATSSSVTDIVGNPLAANSVATFTTSAVGDTTAPQIMFAKGDEYSLAVTFSEAMNSAKITDSNNWLKSILNPLNFKLKYGLPATDFTSGGTAVDLSNASFEYDALSNTVKINKIGLDYASVSGNDYFINMASTTVATASSTGATDLSSNTLAVKTSFQMPIESSATTKGMLGPTSGGMTGGMMGPSMSNMGMMKAGVFPMNSMASATTTYFVKLPTTKAIASDYKIVLTYPQGFDVSGAKKDTNSQANNDINNQNAGVITFSTAAETSGGANNDGVTVDAVARTVTITLTVTGTPPTADYLNLDITGIKNTSIPRNFDTNGYSVDIKIMNASGSLSETVSGMPFFITQGGNGSLSGSVTLSNATGATDGTISVYLGSPMTGPMSQDITITDGSGNYSFSGLSAGQYMIFTDPILTVGEADWGGLSMPEPVTVSGATTKNLTFAKQAAGGGLKEITVSITGAFGTDNIDIFAGSPSGYKVKTINSAGTNPSTSLFLGDGNWMVGFGPAMPKGPMSGTVAMPSWMPPMPVEVKISGTGTVATESSGTANDGIIAFSLASADMQIIGYAKDNSGSAIADAEAYAYQPQGGNGMGSRTRTGTDGKFTLKVSAAGNYTVGVFKPGLPSVPDKNIIVKANTGAVDGNSTADVYTNNALITASNLFNFIIKKPGYTISGKLSNGTNPVTYAPIWADKSSGMGHADTMTDSSGNYILYVDNGSWNVNGYIPGYGNAEQQTVVINGANATQNLAPSASDSTSRYDVSGTITINGSAQANRPLRAVEYSATGSYLGNQYSGSTDSNGAYNLSLPNNKYYRIDIWTPDFGEVGLDYDEVANSLANIRINGSATTTADITIAASNLITTTISLTNKSGYAGKEGFLKIEGTASSSNAWLPTGFNKSLRINDVSGADQTVKLEANKNYQFFLDVPGVGRYMPKVDADTGQDPTTRNVIATTTNRTVIFELASSTAAMFTVSGTIKDGSNVALGNARVWVGNSSGYNNGTETAADGTYSLKVPVGTNYRIGAMKPGYLSPEPSSLSGTANSTATKNITLTASSITLSGYIYNDANSNSSYDSGEAIANGWVRAETTDGAKVANSPVDGSGYYSLGVSAGTWRIYGMADGYKETQHTANVTITTSNQTANIKLTANADWLNTSNLKPIIPANGGTIDDTASSSTGVKLTIPPNALGSSSSNGSVTTAITSAVAKTNSTQPFNDSGRRITATDNSGQAITNLNDYINMDMVIYKNDVAAAVTLQATTSLAIYNELKTTDLGYWDATLNDWVKMSTTRTAYYKAASDATEWTLYVNATEGDDFSEFIDTLIAGTSYYDYKLIFSSSTNHLTIFAVILPYIATAAAAAVTAPAAPASSGGGGGNLQQSVCSIVLYEDWQTTCSNGWQYRNIKSQSPSGCILTTAQEDARKRACGVKAQETTATPQTTETAANASPASLSQAATAFAQKIIAIAAEAAEVLKADINSFLGKFGFKRDLAKESVGMKKYVKSLIKDAKGITTEKQNALNNFITYGTDTTKALGEGERAGVINSYKSAFGKLPATEAEWTDAIKIANGRWPSEKNTKTETAAATAFKKIYGRAPNRANANDDAAVTIIAYGLRPIDRNLTSEKAAIKSFKYFYGYSPVSAMAWDIVRAIAYSGATR